MTAISTVSVPPFQRAAEFLGVLGCGILIVTVLAGAWLSYRDQRESEQAFQLRHAESVTLMLGMNTRDTIASIDDALRDIKNTYEREGARTDIARVLHDHRSIVGYVAGATIADEQGRLILSNLPITSDISVADREHFRTHIEHDDSELFLSKPILGRVSGKQSIQFTRRINRADGSFGGVAGVSVDLVYWNQLLAEAAVGVGSTVALIGRDGVTRALQTHGSSAADIGGKDWGFLIRDVRAGRTRGIAMAGEPGAGTTRGWSYRTVDRYPLVVAVALGDDDAGAHFGAIRATYIAGAVTIAVLAMLLTWMLIFFFNRQRTYLAEHMHDAERVVESEQKFHNLFDQNPLPLWVRDLETHRILEVNEAAVHAYGYAREEFLRMTTLELYKPEDRAMVRAWHVERNPGMPWGWTARHQTKSGEIIDVIAQSSPIQYLGRPARLALALDVTAQKRAERALAESEERYRATVEQSPVGILYSTVDGYIVKVNPRLCEMLGYREEELLHLRSRNIINPEDLYIERERRMTPLLAGEIKSFSSDKRFVRKDGSGFWGRRTVSVIRDADGKPQYIVRVIEDVTQTRAFAERYRELFEANPFPAIVRAEGSLNVLAVNQAAVDKYGYTREEFARMTAVALQSPGTRQEYLNMIQSRRSGGKESNRRTHVTKDGRLLEVEISAQVVNFEGHPARLAVVNDITARLEAECALHGSEARLRTIANHISEGLALYDAQDRLAFFNEPFRRMQGHTLPDLQIGTSFEAMLQLRAAAVAKESNIADVEAYIENRRSHHRDPQGRSLERTRPDGTRLLIREVKTAAGETVATYTDITELRSGQASLRESEERFRAIFDNAGVGITLRLATDRHVPWLAVNDKFCEMTGYAREELMRMSTADITPVEETDAAVSDNQRMLCGETTSYVREKRIVRKDGRRIWVSLSVSALPDTEGRPHRLIATYQDIHARKSAELALQETTSFLQLVVNTHPSMIFVKNDAGKLVFVNQYTARYYGTTPDQLIAKSTEEFHRVEAETRQFVNDEQEVVRTRTSIVREELNTAPNGAQHWFHSIKVPLVRADGTVEVLGVATDITERKHYAMELETMNAQLEQRVAQRTAQLMVANQELESFAHSVSHDLRAPLRHINGFSEVLLQEYSEKLDSQGREYLHQVRNAAARMKILIEDLLRLSRVTQAELQMSDVDLSAIAEEIAGELRRDNPERMAVFRIAPDLQVWGDPGLLRSALVNLLQNAWKFTGKKQAATIEVGASQRSGSMVFFVRDDGAGFNMAYADKLFGVFQRLHAERDFPGTGIGLATVRRVMRRHGGDVWAESEVGKGATFYFTVSDKPVTAADPVVHNARILTSNSEQHVVLGDAETAVLSGCDRPVTVLLVDDDESVLMLLWQAFSRDGHTLFRASSGEEGLAILSQHKIEVIVSDYSMSGMSGADFLKRVAALYPDTVRIILSGQASNDAVEAGIRNGEIYRHIHKQRDYTYLRACVRTGLESVRREYAGTAD